MTSILRRTTYIVEDIEKSISFYRDGIGLNLLWQTETELNGSLPIGKTGDKIKFVAFNGEDPVVGMVAFMQLLNYQIKPLPDISKLDTGNSILVLGVKNCRQIFKNINAMGAKIHKPPFENSVTGRDGKKINMLSMFAWDPNNIFLEINQRL